MTEKQRLTREQIEKLKKERPERLHLYYQYASYNVYELNRDYEDLMSFDEWDKHHDEEGRWIK